MSNAGQGHVFGLGTASCGARPCPVVIGSDDNGKTWTSRASLTGLPPRDGQPQIRGIRFANPEVGFAYGDTVLRTEDGGQSWSAYDPGARGTVLSAETDGRTVWFALAQCTGERCDDSVEVRRAPVGGGTPQHVHTEDLPTDIAPEGSWIAMDGATAYLNATAGVTRPVRLTGKPEPIGRPGPCDAGPFTVATAANERGTLVGVCRATPPRAGYQIFRSTDAGATWERRADRVLGPPGDRWLWVTAVDRDHVVAASPGSGPLRQSSDGGRTWRGSGPGGAGEGWVWAGAAGGPTVYAVSGGPSFALSTDAGETFTSVPLR
jgi:hypothetical protein